MSPHTVCACDRKTGTVSIVSVTDDIVTATLRKPASLGDEKPYYAAVLGDCVLFKYDDENLVVYENGLSSAGSMVTWPPGLESVRSLSSDGVATFLVCDESNSVFFLDASGKLYDKIKIDTGSQYSQVCDCTVVDGKLWAGCDDGHIIEISLQ